MNDTNISGLVDIWKIYFVNKFDRRWSVWIVEPNVHCKLDEDHFCSRGKHETSGPFLEKSLENETQNQKYDS